MSYSLKTLFHHWVSNCPVDFVLRDIVTQEKGEDGKWYDVVVVECLVKAEEQQ